MFGFVRVSTAVPELQVGGIEFNTNDICKKITKTDADVIVFPELCITGYTCGDLFFQRALLDDALASLKQIVNTTKKTGKLVAVGLPLEIGGQLYNCAAVIADGKVCGIVPKTFLPNYNEFYEKRWFSSSEDLSITELKSTELGIDDEYDIPVGRNLIFDIKGVKIGVEICEDLWTPIPPSTFLCLGGAELILNLSASNETISKRNYRKNLVIQQSARNICGYVYASAGECESTTDLVFSGHCLVAENGTLICENEKYIDGNYSLSADIDLEKIRADRMKLKSFNDTAKIYGFTAPCRTVMVNGAEIKSNGELLNIRKNPFVPSEKSDRVKRCREIFAMQVAGLKKRLAVTGSKPAIGVSGGLDSTLALLVCVQAVKELDRPAGDVVGITMPCFGTSGRTYNNSLELMKTLGVTSVEINIKASCEQHFNDIGHDMQILDGTYENSQARERTQVLMDYASRVGGFVVGTGDLSELALGWCTYNGDHISMYGVNVSIPKTLVRWMIDSIIEYDIFEKSTAVLKDVLDTPISPELLPPDKSGKISQETESIVGPYILHDFFLYYILRYGFEPEKVLYLAKLAFDDDYDESEIKKWLKAFYRRFFSQQFKRSCLPDGVKVGSICLSPRGDWRMPSDASAKTWLDRIEKL